MKRTDALFPANFRTLSTSDRERRGATMFTNRRLAGMLTALALVIAVGSPLVRSEEPATSPRPNSGGEGQLLFTWLSEPGASQDYPTSIVRPITTQFSGTAKFKVAPDGTFHGEVNDPTWTGDYTSTDKNGPVVIQSNFQLSGIIRYVGTVDFDEGLLNLIVEWWPSNGTAQITPNTGAATAVRKRLSPPDVRQPEVLQETVFATSTAPVTLPITLIKSEWKTKPTDMTTDMTKSGMEIMYVYQTERPTTVEVPGTESIGLTIEFYPGADLKVEFVGSPLAGEQGGTVPCTVKVTNDGPQSSPATVLNLYFPPGLSVASVAGETPENRLWGDTEFNPGVTRITVPGLQSLASVDIPVVLKDVSQWDKLTPRKFPRVRAQVLAVVNDPKDSNNVAHATIELFSTTFKQP